jgi:hypothetical protein
MQFRGCNGELLARGTKAKQRPVSERVSGYRVPCVRCEPESASGPRPGQLASRVCRSDRRCAAGGPRDSARLPRPGHTRFYVLTSNGVVTADAPERDFGENRHVLSPLFYAGQEVITEIRSADGIG